MAEITKIRQAAILAGGMGMRLRPYTYHTPKVLVPINERPFLAYLIDLFKKNGIEEVVMILGYLPEKVQEYLGDGSEFGISVKYSIGGIEDATGTRVRNAQSLLDDTFLLCYCDNYLNLDFKEIFDFHQKQGAPATMTVYSNEYGTTKNNVLLSDDGYVVKYDKKRMEPGLNGVDAGFFVLDKKEAFDLMPSKGEFWIDVDFLPKLVELKKLAGFRIDRPYYSMGDPDRMKATEEILGPKKVIFLDRDGVINKKMPIGEYVRSPEEFTLLPGVKEAMRLLVDHGYEIYIISNQAGVGRGVMRESDLFRVHQYMEAELGKAGVKIAGIYYCPHKVEDNCKCRKPKAGMLYQASIEHRIDLAAAIFVGDDPRDIEAGIKGGCTTKLLKEGDTLLDFVTMVLAQGNTVAGNKSEQPLVAITMKTYNREGYLKRALDSLLAQTYKNFVLIISDNASPDGTQALCEALAKGDQRIRYVRQKTNIGIFPNFNFTIRAAVEAADYCLFVSDDDVWEPTFVEKCMEMLLNDEEAIVAFTAFADLFEDGSTGPFDSKLYLPYERNLYKRLKQFIPFYSTEGKAGPIFGVFRKRAIANEVIGSYYEHDVSFVLRCLSRGPCDFLDEVLFYKGVLPGKESTKDQPMTAQRIVQSFKNRFERVGTEFLNMRFIWGISELSAAQRTKLLALNVFVICRLFVQRKT